MSVGAAEEKLNDMEGSFVEKSKCGRDEWMENIRGH